MQDPEVESDGFDFDDEDEYEDEEDDHVTEVQPQTQGGRMVVEASMTYLRCTRRKTGYYEPFF